MYSKTHIFEHWHCQNMPRCWQFTTNSEMTLNTCYAAEIERVQSVNQVYTKAHIFDNGHCENMPRCRQFTAVPKSPYTYLLVKQLTLPLSNWQIRCWRKGNILSGGHARYVYVLISMTSLVDQILALFYILANLLLKRGQCFISWVWCWKFFD